MKYLIKKVIVSLLVVSITFSNTGFATLAESVDDIVNESSSIVESSSEEESEPEEEETSESEEEIDDSVGAKVCEPEEETDEPIDENLATASDAEEEMEDFVEAKLVELEEEIASTSDTNEEIDDSIGATEDSVGAKHCEPSEEIATTSNISETVDIATESNIENILKDVEVIDAQESTPLLGATSNYKNYGTLIDLYDSDRLVFDLNWYNKFFGTTYDKSDIKKIEFKAGVDINNKGWNLLEEVSDATYGKVYKLLSKDNVGENSLWSNWGGFPCNDIYPYPPHGTEDGAAPYKFLRDSFLPTFSQYYKDRMILMTTTEEGWGRGGYPHTLRTFDSYIRIPTGDEVDAFADGSFHDLRRMKEKLTNGSEWWILEHIHNDNSYRGEGASVFPADGNYDPLHGGDKYTSYKYYSLKSGVRAVMTMQKDGLKPEPGTTGAPVYTYEIYNKDDTSDPNYKLIGFAYLFNAASGGYNLQINMLYGNAFNINDATALFTNFSNCKEINGLDLLDFSGAVAMTSMFDGCSTLDTFKFVNPTITSLPDTFGENVTNINSMFKDCESLSNFNFLPDNFAPNATTMVSTFENTKISSWPTKKNTSNVTDMSRMLSKNRSATFDFDSADLSACTDVSEMFAESATLSTITVNSNFLGLPATVIASDDMFKDSVKLVGGGGFSYKDQFVDGDFARVDFGGIMPGYFTCTDSSVYNNTNITITGDWRNNFAAEGVLTAATKILFTHEDLPAESANDIDMPLIVNGDPVTGKAFLMNGDGSLIIQFVPQITKLNTTDSWARFFQGFENVTSIEGLDLIDTSPITSLEQTFNNCKNLATISIASFKTQNVTTIESAFEDCEKLTHFVGDIPTFNSLVNAQYAFKNCRALTNIKIDPFLSSGLLYANELFRNCSSLTNIYANQRIVNSTLSIDIYNSENMFDGCTSLTGGQGTIYTNNYPKNINMANTDFGGIKPGYFTLTNTSLYNNVIFTVPNTWFDLAKYTRSKADVKEVRFIEGSPTSATDFDVMFDMDGSYDKVKFYLKTDSDGKYIAKIYTGCSLIRKTKLPTNMSNFFSGFSGLTTISGWDKVDMTDIENMKGLFKDCSSLTTLDLTSFNTSDVINMSEMFRGCTNLTTITVTTDFVTTQVTNSSNMFTDCTALQGDHGTTYTAKYTADPVTAVDKTHAWLDARHGFDGYFTGTATGYTANSISVNTKPETTYYIGDYFFPNGLILNVTWDDGVTTQIPYNAATAAKFTFAPPTDQELTPADTTETITYGGQTTTLALTINPAIAYTFANNWFNGAGVNKNTVKSISFIKFPAASPSSVTREWDIPDSNGLKGYVIADGSENDIVVYAPHIGTILGAQDSSYLFSDSTSANSFTNLTTINNLAYLVTSRMTDMKYMFESCSKLQSLDLRSFNTLNVQYMQYMFHNCAELVAVNTSSFNTSKVINMQSMFDSCTKLSQVYTANFNTSSARNLSRMFYDCNSLSSLDVSKFKTSGVTNMEGMFYNCSNLTSLNLSGFDMGVVILTEKMFYGCSKLTSIGNVALSANDIRSCESMFEGCSELTNINLSNFNTANMGSDGFKSMFKGCSKVKTITLGDSFVLGSANSLANMFNGCESLTSINLSSFSSNYISDVTAMFKNNKKLKTIVASNSFAVKGKTGSDMFEGCDVLEGGAGTKFSVAGVTNSSYAQVDEGSTNPGYFTWAGDVTITFVGGNGARGSMPPQIVKRNVPTTLNANKFRKTGYTFLYWKDAAGNIYTKTITAYDSMTLTAQWQEVYYPPSGGNGSSGSGGGSAGIISNLIQVNRISIDGVLTIKEALNDSDCSWNYDPINNKWRLNTAKDANQAAFANNGFYAINTLSSQIIDANTIVIVTTSVYYFDAAGFMYTGLIDTKGDGKEYLFEIENSINEGQLFKGWKKINGYWYYFGPDGAMYKNQLTPDGYYVDAEGRYRN